MNNYITVIISKQNFKYGIGPADRKRDWMDNSHNKFAYRCLPLTIANQYGWDIYLPFSFSATWNGDMSTNGVTIVSDETNHLVISRFGSGIITFNLEIIVKSDPTMNLMVTGPLNKGKNYIYPLSGVIETDWMPYTFTMNYQFTESMKTVRFDKGEAICRIFPVPKNIEDYKFTIDLAENHPDIKQEEKKWAASREKFMNSTFSSNKDWSSNLPGLYYKGEYSDASNPQSNHKIRLNLDLSVNEEITFRAKIFENIVSQEECTRLIDYAKQSTEWERTDNEFWNERCLNITTIANSNLTIAKLMLDIRKRMKVLITEGYQLNREIFPDLLQVVRWPVGSSQPVHADACKEDGTSNGLDWRDFGSVIYLNDDYTGGRTYYKNFNVETIPKFGSMVVHPGDLIHDHGVTEVEGATRYTIAVFWTFDRNRYDNFDSLLLTGKNQL